MFLKSSDSVACLQERLREIEDELTSTENKIKQMSSVQEKYINFKNQLELKRHELSMIQKRLQQTSHHQLQEEVDKLKTTIAELTEKMKVSKEIEQKSNQKAKELESKMKDSKGHRERVLKEAETEMKKMKQKADKSRDEWKKREQEYETLILEISELKKEIESIQAQIVTSEETLKNMKEQYETLRSKVAEIQVTINNFDCLRSDLIIICVSEVL